MKVIHLPDIDYVSIEFRDVPEAKSYLENGIIVREDKKGNIIGIDILDSSKLFGDKGILTMKEACRLLGISEATMRRKIKQGKIKFTKPNGKDYRFKKSDILKFGA
ncbi:MAG: hypothetical protein C5B49_12920 [Bdellovibrio sp.]|nr:MAG: hypothetical protein C5B49_12920 [Bdellovibrio sp.]